METPMTKWLRARIAYYSALHELKLVEMFSVALRLSLLTVEGVEE